MNIYSKLLTSLLSTALIPLLVVAIIVYMGSRTTLVRVAHDNLNFNTRTLGTSIGEMIEGSFSEVEAWSKLDTAQAVFTGDDIDLRLGLLLRDLQEAGDFHQIWCVDATGKIVASSNFSQVERLTPGVDAVAAVLEGNPYISDVEAFRGSNEDGVFTLLMAHPIYGAFDDETVIGGIVAFYDWENVVNLVRHETVAPDPESQVVLLLSAEGQVIAAADPEMMLNRRLTLHNDSASDGEISITDSRDSSRNEVPMISGTSRIDSPNTGIHYVVFAAVEERAVLRWLKTLGVVIVVTSMLAIAGVIMMSVILARSIGYPIVRLSQTARRIAEGDLDVAIVDRTSDEIGTLARDLDVMRTNLKGHIDLLDATVRERTIELEETIARLRTEIKERMEAEQQTKVHQQQLLQADKMVSLGILVSGVAHEINNPNALITLNVPVIAEAWAKALPVLEEYFQEHGDFSLGAMNYSEMRNHIPSLLADMREGSNRIQKIVSDLKAFSRKETTIAFDPVDVNEVVESAVGLVASHLEKCTDNFVVTYGPDLPPALGDLQRLEQVVINLLINACDALENKQQGIRVETNYDEERDEVRISIHDDGSGINEDDLQHVTDPFFTTKRASGGTGLGLSVSAAIVEEHSGRLEFQSNPKGGTTVIMSLPTKLNSKVNVHE